MMNGGDSSRTLGRQLCGEGHPRARRDAITGIVGDGLKLLITATPVNGKPTAACIEFFATLLRVPRSSVTIASGLSSQKQGDSRLWVFGRRD